MTSGSDGSYPVGGADGGSFGAGGSGSSYVTGGSDGSYPVGGSDGGSFGPGGSGSSYVSGGSDGSYPVGGSDGSYTTGDSGSPGSTYAVSYTHLTLPTILLV